MSFVDLADLEQLARDSATSIRLPGDYPARDAHGGLPFPQSPAIDYGRFNERTPWFVLKPHTVDALRLSVRWLCDRRVPFTTRGSAHSSGGRVLIDRGAVMDLSGLDTVPGYDADTQLITAQGGARWHDVVTLLAPLGRVPRVWTDNLQTTVAGTLSVGGFGDTTSRYGLQIDNVEALSLLTIDGEIHDVGPGHPLFDYTLAGCGQLGIIVEARVRTMPRRLQWMGVHASWVRIGDYVDDMTMLMDGSAHEVFRGNATLGSSVVDGFIGDLLGSGTIGAGPWPRKGRLRQVVRSAVYREEGADERRPGGSVCAPALELVLPIHDGLSLWEDVHTMLMASDVLKYFPAASATVGVFRGRSECPLAPLPGTDFALGIGLRPWVPRGDVQSVLHVLHGIAARVLDGGGRIYMMSITVPHPQFLDLQFGSHLDRFVALKRAYDPQGLMNPGLIVN